MDKKEEFKEFARKHKELSIRVNNNEITWQKLFEMYDIYGEDNDIWDDYINKKDNNIKKIINNVDIDKIQEHLTNAGKALDIISEFTKKDVSEAKIVADELKPINNFFKD